MSDAKRDDVTGRAAVAADLVALGRKLIERAGELLSGEPGSAQDQAAVFAMAAAQCVRAAEQVESGTRLDGLWAEALTVLKQYSPEVPTVDAVRKAIEERDALRAASGRCAGS